MRYEGDRYVAFAKWWNAKLANGETKGAYLFAEPLIEMKVAVDAISNVVKGVFP